MRNLANTLGKRAYLIRLACGDGLKKPEPMDAFAERLNAAVPAGAAMPHFDSSIVSRIESGIRRVTIEDAQLMASVDPEERGFIWLVLGDDEAAIQAPDVRQARRLGRAELDRAEAQVAAAREAAEGESATGTRGGVRPGNGRRRRA